MSTIGDVVDEDVRGKLRRLGLTTPVPAPRVEPVPTALGAPVAAVDTAVAPEDHEAVARALACVRAVRESPEAVGRLLGTWTIADLWEAFVALAAMHPPGLDEATALEWCDLPPQEWSDEVLAVEYQRWLAGCGDRAACLAETETHRRRREG